MKSRTIGGLELPWRHSVFFGKGLYEAVVGGVTTIGRNLLDTVRGFEQIVLAAIQSDIHKIFLRGGTGYLLENTGEVFAVEVKPTAQFADRDCGVFPCHKLFGTCYIGKCAGGKALSGI